MNAEPSPEEKQAETRSHKTSTSINEDKLEPPIDHYAVGSEDSPSLKEEIAAEGSWTDFTTAKRITHVAKIVGKISLVLLLLYFFICSLDTLSVAIRIIGGYKPSEILSNKILEIPVVGLMCGILFTIVVQSSSTTSSAVVGMVAGKVIKVKTAVPIIMGANIGTSVTNTLLAMVQVDNRDRFRRAFAAATLHDMFNWLTTLVLLPIESWTGYLENTSGRFVENMEQEEKKNNTKLKLLKALTEPLTKRIVKFNDKHFYAALKNASFNKSADLVDKPDTMFSKSKLSDRDIGIIMVILSFIVLLTCLFCIVKTLKSILKGKIASWIRRTSTANLPYCPFLTDYLLILVGTLLTFLVQSSSVFTSTLPPLVSVKAISLERAYPLTLGSNLGTTTTAIIAALAASDNITGAMQIALCHFLFNLTGIILFFPVPFTRFPIRMAKALGNTTAEYRWFALVYVMVLFILLPILFMGLAFAGFVYVVVVASILIFIFLFVITVNWLRHFPEVMQHMGCLQTWDWLPEWMRSLAPYDRMFSKLACCARLKRLSLHSLSEGTPAEAPELVTDADPNTAKVETNIETQPTLPKDNINKQQEQIGTVKEQTAVGQQKKVP